MLFKVEVCYFKLQFFGIQERIVMQIFYINFFQDQFFKKVNLNTLNPYSGMQLFRQILCTFPGCKYLNLAYLDQQKSYNQKEDDSSDEPE